MKKGTKITLGILTGGLAVVIGAVVKLVKDKVNSNNEDAAEADYTEVEENEQQIEDSESEETSEE